MDPKQFKFLAVWLIVIALCQVVQTYHYLVTDAQAGGKAIPVIIEEISSHAANSSHALPVQIQKPIRVAP